MSSNIKVRKIKRLGWRPDTPDKRDHVQMMTLQQEQEYAFPPRVDLRGKLPPVYDQGELGSCTANCIAAAIQYDQLRQLGHEVFMPSRLFIYYNERVIEGTVGEDSGAEMRDGIKTVAAQGNCPEEIWPYDISKFTQRPSDTAYAQAIKHKAVSYLRLYRNPTDRRWTENNFRYVLARLELPFVFGFSAYESFESDELARTGSLQMPSSDEVLLGGHAVMCVGYDEDSRTFIIRNSYGSNWGQNGYYTMPYDYLTDPDLSDDFWIIKVME